MSSPSDPPSFTTEEILPLLIPSVIRDIASLITQSIFYGMYLAAFAVAVYSICKQRRSGLSALVLASSTLALFAIATFLWGSDVAILVRRLDIVFNQTDNDMLTRIVRANSSTAKLRYMNDVMFVIAYLIGDAVIAWRILILWQWELFTVIGLSLLWLGSTATGFGMIGCIVKNDFPSSSLLPKTCSNLGNSSWTISLVFNAVSIGLLAWITSTHRAGSRVIREKRKSKIDRVLSLLVIAGIVYFIIGVPRLTSFANPSLNPTWTRLSFATQVIESSLYQLVGLYPTALTACLMFESHSASSYGIETTGSGLHTTTDLFNRDGSAGDSTTQFSTERKDKSDVKSEKV
ncbi:hypothetical protein BKA62DRAFT_310718 [Auriculariales sp. MPI-PUGE-AT-0066]|nr:hypothetical protein BKA62DRAFT_310718 [Auriculariales sp. MPI-PUGE-AT-0066]